MKKWFTWAWCFTTCRCFKNLSCSSRNSESILGTLCLRSIQDTTGSLAKRQKSLEEWLPCPILPSFMVAELSEAFSAAPYKVDSCMKKDIMFQTSVCLATVFFLFCTVLDGSQSWFCSFLHTFLTRQAGILVEYYLWPARCTCTAHFVMNEEMQVHADLFPWRIGSYVTASHDFHWFSFISLIMRLL